MKVATIKEILGFGLGFTLLLKIIMFLVLWIAFGIVSGNNPELLKLLNEQAGETITLTLKDFFEMIFSLSTLWMTLFIGVGYYIVKYALLKLKIIN